MRKAETVEIAQRSPVVPAAEICIMKLAHCIIQAKALMDQEELKSTYPSLAVHHPNGLLI